MRTRTVCGVSSGDPPLVVSWLKDGQPLTPILGANVSALDPYSSLLSISSLDSRHSGDFTCVASNPAAEVRYTAKLQVKGNTPSLSPYQPEYPNQKNPPLLWHMRRLDPQVKVLLHLFFSFIIFMIFLFSTSLIG